MPVIDGAAPCLGVVLAAGAGRRMGRPKALIEIDGERLVDRAVRTLREASCAGVLVVVRDGVTVAGATVVVNPDPDRGMGSSLRLALQTARAVAADARAALVVLVDQPGLSAAAVRRMAAAGEGPPDGPPRLAFATYAGRRGHPARIDRPLWDRVAALADGDSGARAFARAHPDEIAEVPCDGLGDVVDLDTPADLARWRRG